STKRSNSSGYRCLPVVEESPQQPAPFSVVGHSSPPSSSSTTSKDPVNPRPCPNSCNTTVTKSYCPDGGFPSNPKYHRSSSLLKVAMMSAPPASMFCPSMASAIAVGYHVFCM